VEELSMSVKQFDQVPSPLRKGRRWPEAGWGDLLKIAFVQTNPLTIALSPRFVVSVLRDSLTGERGQIEVTLLTTFQAA
jgi:hypothetical protein